MKQLHNQNTNFIYNHKYSQNTTTVAKSQSQHLGEYISDIIENATVISVIVTATQLQQATITKKVRMQQSHQ